MPPIKTLFVFHAAGQAEAIQALLESHGIPATLRDENAIRTRSNQAISIALEVAEPDMPRAMILLQEAEPALFASGPEAEKIESEIKHSLLLYVVISLACALVAFFLTATENRFISRCRDALSFGLICAIPIMFVRHFVSKRKNG